MAIVETCTAIPLYWWIATQFGFVQTLITGACVAPLLLLRSPESIALGAEWATKFELGGPQEISTEFRKLSRTGQMAISLVCLVSFATALLLLYSVWSSNYFLLLFFVPASFFVGFAVAGTLTVAF
jgi:hypothetical protein